MKISDMARAAAVDLNPPRLAPSGARAASKVGGSLAKT